MLIAVTGGVVQAVQRISSNDWLHYGLYRLALSELANLLFLWIAVSAATALSMALLYALLGRFRKKDNGPDAAFSAICGFTIAALLTARLGFHLNRYQIKEYWLLENSRELFGVRIPSALVSPKALLANAGVILGGVAFGIAIYYLGRYLLRQRRRLADAAGGRTVRFASLASLAFLIGVAVLSSVSAVRKAEHPNVILISVDTLRADHLRCYGNSRETSPNIDSLASQGVLFENTVSHANWTLPSHMSIMTSQMPMVHGVRDTHHRLADAKLTLAEVLKNAGYSTIGITGGYNVDARFGFGQGFDAYFGDDIRHFKNIEKREHGKGIRLVAQLPRLFGVLAEHDSPFFVFLHAWDPHAPYMPHAGYIEKFSPEYRGGIDMVTHELIRELNSGRRTASEEDIARIRALYDNEILFADDAIGKLVRELKRLRLFDDTVIVFTSDHGDQLMDHGIMNHGMALYNPEIAVPLIVTYPRSIPGRQRVKTVVRSIDIAPTILDLAGIDPPERVARQFHGRSLANSWKKELRETVAISEGRLGRQISLRFLVHKYISKRDEKNGPTEELYDLLADPAEQHNLGGAEPELMNDFRLRLTRELNLLSESETKHRARDLKLDSDFRDKLKSLGYLQ